jgi:quercetin dioxygenase-like cupin family protein
MNSNAKRGAVGATFAIAGSLVLGAASVAAPPPANPVTIPCATDVTAQVFGTGSPATAEGQTLVLARIAFAPGGSIGNHTHPGTLVVTIESGTLGFTLVEDAAMSIKRSGEPGTDVVDEPLTTGVETELLPGDWFTEVGMVHSARAIGDEPAVVTLSGLITAGEPLTKCVDAEASPHVSPAHS